MDPDRVKAGIRTKGEPDKVDTVLQLDQEHRRLLTAINDLRTERNRASRAIGEAKRMGEDASEAMAVTRKLGEKLKQTEAEATRVKQELDTALLALPNLPHDSVPVGQSEADNVIVRSWQEKPTFSFPVKNHTELCDSLGLIDFKRGAKISGSGFPLYTGPGARLERSLLNYMLDFHTERYGFQEIFPPFITRYAAMQTTGQLPKFADDMYHIEADDDWLIPTAEVPVTNIHQDEILLESDLPRCYAAYSACFRREAGSYGKDTRGLLRLHQFNKVELVKFVHPDTSYDELETLTAQAEAVLQSLGLTYRVLALATGDLSFSAAKCYDLEVWAPGEGQWLEVSSCSNFESFQARRGNIRFRSETTRKVDFVHTLNGSGLATPRLMVALLETYQQADGSVRLPEPLSSYFGQDVIG